MGMGTETLAHDVFTETVTPLIRAAKRSGATPDSLSQAFLAAVSDLYGAAEAKETSAMLGFRSLLASEGGSVPAAEAAKLYGGPAGCSEEAVRKAARAGQVIAIRDGLGNLHFPVWQFSPRGGVLPGLRETLASLREHPHFDDLLPATFFLNPSSRLQGKTPLDALRAGEARLVERVQALAAELAE